MQHTISIPVAGDMGAGIGRVLVDTGLRVLTCIEGRSDATRQRAAEAGLTPVSMADLSAADAILSITPPGIAAEVAGRIAAAVPAGHRPLYLDLNAISPDSAREMRDAVESSGVRFVDGSIIGGPPKPDRNGPRIYISGPDAERAIWLAEHGLDIRALDDRIGTASALKMCYGALTKGLTGMTAAMIMAAERSGIGAALHAEMSQSQHAQLKRAETALPDMYPKAYRWVEEMQQIAEFLGPDCPESGIWRGLAGLYDNLAGDRAGDRNMFAEIERFLAR